MTLKGIFQPLNDMPEFNRLVKALAQSEGHHYLFGLSSSSAAYLIGGLFQARPGVYLLIAPGEQEAIKMVDNLQAFWGKDNVFYFPPLPFMPYQVLARDRDLIAQRMKVLAALSTGKELIVVAPIEALLRLLVPPNIFHAAIFRLAVGERADLTEISHRLIRLGYERVEVVESRGTFAIRGGILDIFPLVTEHPYRVEFFDDEVDSIRIFNPDTQRSLEKVEEIVIYPAVEVIPDEKACRAAKEKILADFRQLISRRPAAAEEGHLRLRETIDVILDQCEKGGIGLENFLAYLYAPATLLDYLPSGSLVIVEESARVQEVAEARQKERRETCSELLASGLILPGQCRSYLEYHQLLKELAHQKVVFFSLLPQKRFSSAVSSVINFTSKGMHNFWGKFDLLAEEIRHWRRAGYTVICLVDSEEKGLLLRSNLQEQKIDAFFVSRITSEARPGNVVISVLALSDGFELPTARLAIITQSDVYGQRKRRRSKRERPSGQRLDSFVDLKVGDYVVHVNHGIGRYLGVVPVTVNGVRKDYLLIQYAGEDKLYVPTDHVGLLQRYSSPEGDIPRLSRLGGSEWQKVKNRVQEAVKGMAQELLKLYAAREARPGFAFSTDTVWQKEFEDAFPYEETPDQLKAIAEVKKDMERPRPMDRLICGDVGYGKTEIAIRAAFKAVMDNKQVAVLVPTTILAQQHYHTFRERFANYPVRIEVLSRFRTPREQKQILADLRAGKIDIIIGTHRLVQDDVVFKDLGLLVVDEEQRFGVVHKEKLKMLKQEVDVLTLTATPIPRTLHMSLVGVRDTSLLETPPENRFPVQTYVLEEDPVIIREAIKRELSRGGQVYFVHNRIQELDRIAAWLQELVPEARLAVAHGQMKEDDLENIMMDFVDGQIDVLVCTTIIESGLDIPNVNTLIVKDANNFGLAQLYQLRGRVGRSNRLAYAYFLYRRDRILGEAAEKRLAAIREFTELGSGFKIAMRDLEIRGAGNILGAEQHGHIAAVGFDLYVRMLEEAVRELKGEEIVTPAETMVELPVNAFIPEDYISSTELKVDFYRRLAAAREVQEVDEVWEEMVDRFGDPPLPVENLLAVARIRTLASRLRIKMVGLSGRYYRLVLLPDHPLSGEKIVAVGEKYGQLIRFIPGKDEFEIRLLARSSPEEKTFLTDLEEFLHYLTN